MEIAFFGHKRIPSREGGVEVVVEELAARMAAAGHRVTCYNRSGHHVSGKEFDCQALRTYRDIQLKQVWTLNKKGFAAVTSSFFAAICASFSHAQVVHIHAEGPAYMCWLPKLFGKKVIVTIHGLDWQREKWRGGFGEKFIHLGEKTAVRFADEIIVLSENVQRYFMQLYGRNTVMIPNGVSKPSIANAQQIQETWGLNKEGYILFLGRLVPEKGVHYLIEAYTKLNTDKKLVIAGGSSDSADYQRRLYDLAAGNPDVLFTGFVQGRMLEELYSNAYIYVLPSDVEGMPLSLLEAMSYGNCCLVSDIPECTEVTLDYAPVFRKGDVSQLQLQLQQLCDRPEVVVEYKRNAQCFICGKYNWDDVATQTLEIYK